MTEQSKETLFDSIRSQRCLVCSKLGVDVAHVKTRGSGGPDEAWNLMSLCRRDHAIQHQIGIVSFIRLHPTVAAYLASNGWVIENGKLWNDRLNPSL